MRTKINILFILLVNVLGYGQSTSNPTPNGYSKIPVSPTAASLGQYGTVPVGLYSGTAQFNVPLYIVQGKNLAIPIELNYSTNGIKVENISPWVGAGWSLNAGGVITRDIKGKADDFHSYSMPDSAVACLPKTDSEKFENGIADLEYDRFSYNFMGNVGTFYIISGVVKQIEQGNGLKFEVPATSPSEFIVTDKSGVKYYFGKNYVTGDSSLVNPVESTGVGGNLNITSWYLAKIVHLSGETIYLTYINGFLESQYGVGYNQYKTMPIAADNSCPTCPAPNNTWSTLSPLRANLFRNVTIFLKSIYTDDLMDRVDFVVNTTLNSNNVNKLQKIKGTQKNIDFTITTPTISPDPITGCYRYYLDEVNFKSTDETGNVQGEKYSFEYYDKNIVPTRFTASRDNHGYYNGANPADLFDGDHSGHPEYAKNGSLKKIIYPTKGYTEIEYEGNIKSQYGCTATSNVIVSSAGITNGLYTNNSTTFEVNVSQSITFYSEYAYVNPNIPVNGTNTQGNAKFIIESLGEDPFFITVQPPNGSTNFIGTKSVTLTLGPGSYTITASVIGKNYRASCNFSLCLNYDFIPIQLGGIRLQRVSSYSSVGVTPIIKSYSYDQPEEATVKRLSYISVPDFSCGSGSIIPFCQSKIESSTGPLNSNGSSNEFFYKNVTENFENGTQKSYYIEHMFEKSPYSTGQEPIFGCNTPISFDIEYFGVPKETKTIYYKKTAANTFVWSKKEEFKYSNDFTVADKSYKKEVITTGSTAADYANSQNLPCVNYSSPYSYQKRMRLSKYNYILVWQKLDSKIVSENILNASDVSIGTIVNQTDYFYGNLIHKQLTKEVIKTSEFNAAGTTNKTKTVKYSYPDDVTSVSSLYGDNLNPVNYNALVQMMSISQNVIGLPIQIEKLDDALDHIETKRFCYENFNSGLLTIALLTKVQTLKGNYTTTNMLIDEQVFSNYNMSILRPQQITSGNNINPTCYVFGYKNRYPIAIIKNKLFDSSISSLIVTYSSNPTYTDGNFDALYATLNEMNDTLFTLYKHKPLIGIEKIIEANYYSKHFYYDNLNRLLNVKDTQGNIQTENIYNYKPQN